MGDLVLKGATSGQITLSPTGTAGTNTLTLPAKTGNIITSADTGTVTQTMLGTNIAGNGPAFSAYPSASQTISHNVATKVQFNTKTFDTNTNFDASTNYRFTPTTAGYYQIDLAITMQLTASRNYYIKASVYKNGAEYKSTAILMTPPVSSGNASVVPTIVSMNGSTDYLEGYIYIYDYTSSGTTTTTTGAISTEFCGSLIRSA